MGTSISDKFLRGTKILSGYSLFFGGMLLFIYMFKSTIDYYTNFVNTINSTTEQYLITQITLKSNLYFMFCISGLFLSLIGSVLIINTSKKEV